MLLSRELSCAVSSSHLTALRGFGCREEKIRKTVAKELGQPRVASNDPNAYNEMQGFFLFIDWIHEIPASVGVIMAIFCLYDAQEPLTALEQLEPAECLPIDTDDPKSRRFAVMGYRKLLDKFDPSPHVHVVIEFKKVCPL